MTATHVFLILFASKLFLVLASDGKIEWISVHPSQIALAHQYPDGIEGQIYTYICRATHGSGLYSGKLLYEPHFTPMCMYGVDWKQFKTENFEILSAPKGSLSWQQYEGSTPSNSIVGGHVEYSPYKNVTICRGWVDAKNTTLVTGYKAREKICYVPFSTEHRLTSFEILVRNNYGTLLNY